VDRGARTVTYRATEGVDTYDGVHARLRETAVRYRG